MEPRKDVVCLVQKLYNSPLKPNVIQSVSSIMVVPTNSDMEPAVLDISGMSTRGGEVSTLTGNSSNNGVEDSIIFVQSNIDAASISNPYDASICQETSKDINNGVGVEDGVVFIQSNIDGANSSNPDNASVCQEISKDICNDDEDSIVFIQSNIDGAKSSNPDNASVCQETSKDISNDDEDSIIFVQSNIDGAKSSNPDNASICQERLVTTRKKDPPIWSYIKDELQESTCDDDEVVVINANDKSDSKEDEIIPPPKWQHCKQYLRKKNHQNMEQIHINNHNNFMKLKKQLAVNVSYINIQNNTILTETLDPMSRLSIVDETRSLLTQEYVSSVLSALDADLSYSVFNRENKVKPLEVDASAPLSPRKRDPDKSSPQPYTVPGQTRSISAPDQGKPPQPAAVTVAYPLHHFVQQLQQHLSSLPPLIPFTQASSSDARIATLPELRLAPVQELQIENRTTLQGRTSGTFEEPIERSPAMDVDECSQAEEPVRWSNLPDNLCRVCAKASSNLEYVFSKTGEELHLADLVHNHLPIMVTPDDLLPTHICSTCISRLQASESLVRTCIEADTTLRELLDGSENTQSQLRETNTNTNSSNDMDDNWREDHIFAGEDDFADSQNFGAQKKKKYRGTDLSTLLSQEDVSLINKMKGDGLKVTLVRVPNLSNLPEEKKHQRVLQVLRTMNMNKLHKRKAVGSVILKPSRDDPTNRETANISPVDDLLQDISSGSALRDNEATDDRTLPERQPDSEPTIFSLEDVDPPVIDLGPSAFSSIYTQPSPTQLTPNISVSADAPSMLRDELLDGINYAIKQGHVAKTGSIIKLSCKKDDGSTAPSSVYVYVRNKDTPVNPQVVPRRILDLDLLHQHQMLQRKERIRKAAAKAAKHQAAIARRRARVREKRKTISERKSLTCEECEMVFNTKKEFSGHRMIHLKCRFCGKQFSKKPSFVEHERVHTKEKPFICEQCGKAFRTRTQLVQHAQIHNTDCPYVCQVCGRKFSVRKTYQAHLDSHSADSPFLCETCGKCFKVQVALRLHRMTHRSFNCNLCNKVFSYRAYQVHKKSHAGEESKYPCSYCNKKFLTSHRLKIHFLIHEAIYPFSCSVCRRSFKRMTHLQAHQSRHPPELLEGVAFFCCAICQVQYEQPSQLSQHIKTHSEEERQSLQSFKCHTCNKCFSVERELRSHELRHIGKQTFSCGTCNRAFDTKKEFDEHSDTHTEEKPFVCEVCGKRFRALLNLSNHQQIHLSFKPYPCQSCPKAFKTVNGLNQHKVVHSEVRKHTCGICSMGFKRRDAMKNHERTHFSERPYACSICGRAFKVKADCSTHLKRHREAGIEGTIMESCYTCPVCSANFSLKVELTTHVQSVHDLEVAVLDKDDNLVLVPDVEVI